MATSNSNRRKQAGVSVTVLPTAEAAHAVPSAGPSTSASEDDEELTSHAAARLLRVSRSHLNTLADSGALGEMRLTAGNQRRFSKAALLDYKTRSKERQSKGLDTMMEASRKLGLYGDELAKAPRRRP